MNIGLSGILGVLFITLKLLGYITWSWVWVLCPFWIGAAIVILLYTIAVIALFKGRNRY